MSGTTPSVRVCPPCRHITYLASSQIPIPPTHQEPHSSRYPPSVRPPPCHIPTLDSQIPTAPLSDPDLPGTAFCQVPTLSDTQCTPVRPPSTRNHLPSDTHPLSDTDTHCTPVRPPSTRNRLPSDTHPMSDTIQIPTAPLSRNCILSGTHPLTLRRLLLPPWESWESWASWGVWPGRPLWVCEGASTVRPLPPWGTWGCGVGHRRPLQHSAIIINITRTTIINITRTHRSFFVLCSCFGFCRFC